MADIIYLATASNPSTACGVESASAWLMAQIAGLVLQNEQLQRAMNDVGGYLRKLADAVDEVENPETQARFHQRIDDLRCQLLLALIELHKMNGLQRKLTLPSHATCSVHSPHHA